MKKALFQIALLFMLTSCNNKKSNGDTSATSEKSNFSVQVQKQLPPEIEGCGAYLVAASEKIGSKKYLFLSDLSDFGMIAIDGKKIALKKNEAESKIISDDDYISVYENNGIKVSTHLKKVKAYDEGGVFAGKMTVTKDGASQEMDVHGECGC